MSTSKNVTFKLYQKGAHLKKIVFTTKGNINLQKREQISSNISHDDMYKVDLSSKNGISNIFNMIDFFILLSLV